jgi:hypothetical protein
LARLGIRSALRAITKEIHVEKAVEFKFEGSKLLIAIDPNKDGGPVLKLEIDLAEIPDEVMSVISAKKAV